MVEKWLDILHNGHIPN